MYSDIDNVIVLSEFMLNPLTSSLLALTESAQKLIESSETSTKERVIPATLNLYTCNVTKEVFIFCLISSN